MRVSIINATTDDFQENVLQLQEEIQLAMKSSDEYDWATRRRFEETFDMSKYPQVDDNATYDFIIVGAGAAGSALAARLSEKPQFKVLLLEAGNYGNSVMEIPKFGPLFLNSHYNWNFTLERQENACLGKQDNICTISAGRAIGGSTAINDMIWTRGTALDFSTSPWKMDEILATFIEMENAQFNYTNDRMHGTQGPIHLEHPRFNRLDHSCIFDIARELNIPEIDYNDWDMSSKMPNYIGQVQSSTRLGRRWSAAKAYLTPRQNLIVKANAHVLHLDIDEGNVKKVTYLQEGKIVNVKVGKEVILSAGAINSAKLLQISGVGPKQLLNQLGIDVKVDLPSVGRNLKTQIYYNGLTFLQDKNANESNKNATDLRRDIEKYLKEGKGALTWASSELIAFLSAATDNRSDIELAFVPGANNAGYEDVKIHGVKENIYDSLYKSTEGRNGFQLVVILLHPVSTDWVRIKSKNPMAQTQIHLNLFDHPQDITRLIDGIKMALNFTKTPSFKQLHVQLNENKLKECDNRPDDDYWRCMLMHLAAPTQHLTGTSRIGDSNLTSVVDKDLRVHGVGNLRVADAGVLPNTITGHTMAPTVMIGEMAAKIIKRHYLQSST